MLAKRVEKNYTVKTSIDNFMDIFYKSCKKYDIMYRKEVALMNSFTRNDIKDFKQYLENEEKAEATVKKYLRDIEAFFRWCGNRELCKEIVLRYKGELVENYAPTSVNSMLSSLNMFFQFQGWHELKVKILKIQKQIFMDQEKHLTKQEYQRLLAAAKTKGNIKLYLLMQTICSTGIRVSELKYITLESLSCGMARIHLKGKIRTVVLPHALCKSLIKYATKEKITKGSIFVSKSGKPLDRSNIWKMMNRICSLANVLKEKVFPHNLRHLFACTFYSACKDIVRLADILGHSSVNTTRIYTMEPGELRRRQIQSLGLLRC